MPIRVVITLLGTLVTTPIFVIILASIDGSFSPQIPVRNEKAHISLAKPAVVVIIIVLMHAKLQVSVAVKVVTLSRVVRNCAGEKKEKKHRRDESGSEKEGGTERKNE